MEPETGKLPAEIALELLPNQPCVALSGPNLATEVARGVPAAAVAASTQMATAQTVRNTFSRPSFRVYTSEDLLGVEIGGAIKNVLAIAGGISDGLGYGDNTKATLLTRGLAEMARFGVAFGAKRETFYGLSGVGDLMATASSKLSRNWRVGSALAHGERLPDILARLGQVAEGVLTAQTVVTRAREKGIEMPVCETVAEMLEARISPQEAVRRLMTRQSGEE
jgi:glycerol-3-phosphate dehydrogenase (NAD(P)+)